MATAFRKSFIISKSLFVLRYDIEYDKILSVYNEQVISLKSFRPMSIWWFIDTHLINKLFRRCLRKSLYMLDLPLYFHPPWDNSL